jgi:hypothetical protein
MRISGPTVRLRAVFVAALAAFAVLAVTAVGAQAKIVKLTGQTTVTPSSQAKQFLANNGVSTSTVGNATASNGSFTFPIVAGFANTANFTGILAHSGGLKFTKGTKSAVVRRFVAVRTERSALLLAQVPGLRSNCGQVAAALRRFAATHPGVRRAARRHPVAAQRVIDAVHDYCSDGRVIVLATLTNLGKQVAGKSATLTADLRLSREAARLLNRALGTNVQRGVLLGSATSTVSVGS